MDILFDTLNAIQSKVYHKFTYETDREQYGVDEKWIMPSIGSPFVGDCEDFALECRRLCRESGIQTRLVVCLIDGFGHCVLEASGWIFDCNYDHIVSRDDLKDYNWWAISGFNPQDDWKLITK